MKKGIVSANMIYLKRGGYLHKGADVTENDVNNFDQLVEKGLIEPVKSESELMKLTKAELQDKCKDLGIEFQDSENKSELVDKIESKDSD